MRPLRADAHLHAIGLEQMLEASVVFIDALLDTVVRTGRSDPSRQFCSLDAWLSRLPASLLPRLVHLELRLYFGSRHWISRYLYRRSLDERAAELMARLPQIFPALKTLQVTTDMAMVPAAPEPLEVELIDQHCAKLVEVIDAVRSYSGLSERYVGNVNWDQRGRVVDMTAFSSLAVAQTMMLESHRASVFVV
ncbi:hypothetical protein LTR36_004853 [Oleoguttula mirabilis]|uniref:Uncharacterized protein n=1 Tax=Oleoguttula mirabilis TaxID=1507867 RepID=A0AAV9JF44_9PEZI|nr:hypothetical protein LTR36_004853 [Oleoguttula mirabilis]